MQRAREEVQNFILNRSENIGQNRPHQLCRIEFDPLLSDRRSFQHSFLPGLPGGRLAGRLSGPILALGFQNGLVLLEQEQGVDDSLQPEDVTFILISDGEDHGDQLREAVQKSN